MQKIFAPFVTVLLLQSHLFGFGAVLHYQGEIDDREAYFADVRVIKNRTPPDQIMGPTEIHEIDVTAVYENSKKPEFVHMKLQFECQNSFSMNMETHKITENKSKVKTTESVKFRIGQGSYKLRRSDLQSEPLPVSDWKISDAPMLFKAGAIACNDIEFDKALHAAIKGKDFDFDGFGKRISKLGLPSDMPLIGQTLSPEFLDFAWSEFWWDKVSEGKRPDPSGKWSKKATKADKEAAIKKIEDMQKQISPQVEAAKKSLLEGIKKSQSQRKADLEAAKNADKHPDGSKMNKYEAKLANVFRGESEDKVVEYMGNPRFNQAGNTRFLRYTKSWEKQGVTVYGSQGVIGGDPGGYAECFAEFSLKQDEQGVWRVNDILVKADYEGSGLGRASLLCQDILKGKR